MSRSDRKKPKKAKKKRPPKVSKTREFPAPDLPAVDEKSVYIAGGILHSVYVDEEIKDKVDVMVAVLAGTVLDAAGHDQVDYYRFVMSSDDPVICNDFFESKEFASTGSYQNPNFQAPLVVEGTLFGTDANPDDVGRPISVLKNVKLTHLVDAMTEVEDLMASTEGLEKYSTKVAINSVLNPGQVHPEGSLAVKLNDLDDEGKIWLIEVQAKGWQECFEIEAAQMEKVTTAISV